MLFILKVHRYKISPRFSTKFLRNEILGAVEFGRWRTTGDQTLIFILIKNKPNVTDYGELHFWNEVSTSRKKKEIWTFCRNRQGHLLSNSKVTFVSDSRPIFIIHKSEHRTQTFLNISYSFVTRYHSLGRSFPECIQIVYFYTFSG